MKQKSATPFTLLAVLLTVFLAACGGNTAPKADGQAPTVRITSPATSAMPGSILTINGQNLGTSGTINLGGMHVTPDTWTDTQITLTIPTGAPAGPQELTVTTSAGSETLELFVGIDFPEGTLEQLATLELPKGTAVRLGEGTFESTSETLILDNLSFYGQGETKTTLKAAGSITDPRLLYLYADAEFDLVMTGLALQADATILIPTPLEVPEEFTVSNASSFEALSSMTVDSRALMNSLQVEAGGSFTTASSGVNTGSYELRNVAMASELDGGGFITTGFLLGANSIYMGRLILDNVSYDNDKNILQLLSTESIEIRDSQLNVGLYLITSLGGKTIVDESQLTSTPGSDASIIGIRGLELTDSEFTVINAELALVTQFEPTELPVPSAIIIRNNKITARDANHSTGSDDGMISMVFVPTTALVEKNTFIAEKSVLIESWGGGLTIDDNTFTVGHAPLVYSDGIILKSEFNAYVAFNNNTVDFLTESDFVVYGNDNFIVNDNIINGFGNTGTALIAAQDWPDAPFSITAQRNTFTGFEQALDLSRGSGNEVYTARINNNTFNFPISSAPQAAELWNMVEAEVDLDATNNTWGANTTVADVQSYITYQSLSDAGVLKVDPITTP